MLLFLASTWALFVLCYLLLPGTGRMDPNLLLALQDCYCCCGHGMWAYIALLRLRIALGGFSVPKYHKQRQGASSWGDPSVSTRPKGRIYTCACALRAEAQSGSEHT
jgi:hypothetical protein